MIRHNQETDMSKTKDWMMDMEAMVYEAIEQGFTSVEDVYAYVNTNMAADPAYIEEVLNVFHGGWDG
jgi:hypothetical protein